MAIEFRVPRAFDFKYHLPSASCSLAAEAAAENSTRSYTSALRYWAGWYAARYGIELTLPVPEAAVLQFVVDHVVRRKPTGGWPGSCRGRLIRRWWTLA